MSIFVDEEFQNLIPPLSKEEYTQLEANCVKDGIRDPLVVWDQGDGNSILIDGHNRWNISAAHGGILFKTVSMKFDSREDAKLWIIRNQFGRRNLDSWQLFDLTKELEIIEKNKAKKRMSDGAKGVEIFPQAEGKTRDKMGELIGVSGKTYDKMKKIDKEATPQVKEAVRKGELSINQAYNSTVPKVYEPLKEAKERHADFSTDEKVMDFEAAQQDKRDRETIARAVRSEIGSINLKILKLAIHEDSKAFEDIRLVELPEKIEKLKEDTRKSISILSLIIEKLGG